jgi:50S ribosomal protein 6
MTFLPLFSAQYNASDKRHGPAKYEALPTPPPALIVVSKGESK